MNEHYSIVIEWSNEDQLFVVSLPEWGALIHTHGATYEEAAQQGASLIEELIASRQQRGLALPAPRVYASA
ncbi:MAG TPA: type II toxin-antitoxin system HicB family antitoxin [Ktedonobacterales bacterium]|nr:type II toxin-antitoxin system HicB family antitoxin [Ktedonobacterales bacterium]